MQLYVSSLFVDSNCKCRRGRDMNKNMLMRYSLCFIHVQNSLANAQSCHLNRKL